MLHLTLIYSSKFGSGNLIISKNYMLIVFFLILRDLEKPKFCYL